MKQTETIKIDNLEVMKKDLGYMNWHDATKACEDLGNGWRLPTKPELNTLYLNKDKIGGFANDIYWSSSHGYSLYKNNNGNAWIQSFYDGSQHGYNEDCNNSVRAVRSI